MLEKNRLIHPERKRSRTRHDHFAQVDPNAENTSAFINQAVSQAEGAPEPPAPENPNRN